MRSNSLAARDVDYVLHPMTNARRHEERGPNVMVKGDGCYVIDDQGTRYLDAMAGLWCVSLGFSEPRLGKAAAAQFEKLPYYQMFAHKSHDPGIRLAEKLIEIAPVPMSKVFFANSGSEANDTAVKVVWFYHNAIGKPEKRKIISRKRAYHGITVASGSLTGLPPMHNDFNLPISGILHAGCPHHYREGRPGEGEEQFAARLADELEQLILAEGPETVGAFIAEPVMGAGGVIVPPRGYFERVQAVLKKHDVLFIADEVICGFFRTGAMFGTQTFNLDPDMMVLAKQLSSGYLPISALLVNDKIYQALADNTARRGTFGHGFTYSGHPVSSAVALETLAIYEERDIAAHVGRVAPYFQERLRGCADHPLVGEARGVGLIGALELVADKASKRAFDPAHKVGVYADERAFEHGLITRALVDSLAFTPPLIITEAEIDEAFAKVARALDDTLAWTEEKNLARRAA